MAAVMMAGVISDWIVALADGVSDRCSGRCSVVVVAVTMVVAPLVFIAMILAVVMEVGTVIVMVPGAVYIGYRFVMRDFSLLTLRRMEIEIKMIINTS